MAFYSYPSLAWMKLPGQIFHETSHLQRLIAFLGGAMPKHFRHKHRRKKLSCLLGIPFDLHTSSPDITFQLKGLQVPKHQPFYPH